MNFIFNSALARLMEKPMHLLADLEISLKRGISVAAPFKQSLTQRNSQVFLILYYPILPLNTTQTSELHLAKISWQLKLQKRYTLERNSLPERIPARSLLVKALWKMVCYMYTVYSMYPITKPCAEKFFMRITTTLQLDNLDELPPMNLSAKTTGCQECEKQLLHTWLIVILVQRSNLYVMHLLDFSNLCKSVLPAGVLYSWILLQASRNLVPNIMMLSL